MPNSHWPRKAVVYQIYPISFQDSNADGKGDLLGILNRLDYLQDLGVGAIWLSPINKSPMADFGYDVSDYLDINPIFGTLADLDKLLAEVHKRGMKLLMDFVPNHTSSEHPWFVESSSSKTNPKRDWYIWAKGRENRPPNNWLSVFGGSGWEFDERTEEYYFHSFIKNQPDLNYRNPEVRAAMKNVLKFWLGRGVDGFRVDAVYHLFKDEKLQNNPANPGYLPGTHDPYLAQINSYTHGLPETLEVIKEWCKLLASYGETFLVTEVHVPMKMMVELFNICDPGHHSPFNFYLIAMPWSVTEYKKFIDNFEHNLRAQDLPNYVLGNHDKPRVASRLGHKKARLAAMLQFTLRGMPFIYNGEELGMEDGVIPPELVQDPFEKNVPGFKLGRDPERTPMQWDGSTHAGFTTGTPWLPVNDHYLTVNVEAEIKLHDSMLSLYKLLIRLREGSPALLEGTYQSYELHDDVFCYSRSSEGEIMFVALNFCERDVSFTMPYAKGQLLFNTFLDQQEGELKNNQINLRGEEGIIIKVTDNR